MHKKRPTSQALREMLTEPHFGTSRDLPLADPIMPTPMIVEIDRINLYDRNPRRERNAGLGGGAYHFGRARQRNIDATTAVTSTDSGAWRGFSSGVVSLPAGACSAVCADIGAPD